MLTVSVVKGFIFTVERFVRGVFIFLALSNKQPILKMAKSYNIPAFLKYINVNGKNDDTIQVIHYDEHKNMLLKSPAVQLEFYLMAIKKNIDVHPPVEEMSSSYLFLDKPGNNMEWDLSGPFVGYGIFVNAKLLDKFAKDYTFTGYTRHEALFLTERESRILYDLFIKAYEEYQQDDFSQDVLVSYATLILFIHTDFLRAPV